MTERASEFLIQVIDTKTGDVVTWAPGFAVERQLIMAVGQLVETRLTKLVCEQAGAEGVGIGRTAAHVLAVVRTALLAHTRLTLQGALSEVLYALKAEVHCPPPPGV